MNATVATLADEAARLLPEPPAGHDAFGYLAWEELVVSTARRLHALGGEFADYPCNTVTLTSCSNRLDGPALLSLAMLVADPADPGAGERALWHAVERGATRAQAPLTGSTTLLRLDRSAAAHGPATRRAQRRRRTLLTSVKN